MISVKKNNNLSVEINQARHSLLADVSQALGGDDTGFNPHELLEASLGACTSITVMMFARRKAWPLLDLEVTVKIIQEGEENIISRELHFVGELSEEQKTKLTEIANKCPMHNFLMRKTTIETRVEA